MPRCPVVECFPGLDVAREPHGAFTTKGIEIMMHPVDEPGLLEVARRP